MRTTINIDRDVLDAARNLARQERISVGAAISRLARRGLMGRPTIEVSRGSRLPSFVVPDDAPTFGTEDVKRALSGK